MNNKWQPVAMNLVSRRRLAVHSCIVGLGIVNLHLLPLVLNSLFINKLFCLFNKKKYETASKDWILEQNPSTVIIKSDQ
jgi:hypothetical protein